MLIEFRVENHRSLRDEQVLTLEAGRVGDASDSRPRRVAGYPESLLPVAALYGANASGKSNVLAALAFMRDAVSLSHRVWSPDEGVPRDPFAWGPKRLDPSLFEITICVEDVRYEYGFVASDECFAEEWLFAWPHGKKQVWFEREGGDPIKFGDNLKGENRLIEEVTRPNALFISVAAQHKHPQLTPIFTWFRSLYAVNLSERRDFPFRSLQTDVTLTRLLQDDAAGMRQLTLFQDDEFPDSLLDRFRTLLTTADIGILDMRLADSQSDGASRRSKGRRFELKHQSEVEEAWLPLEEESRGTQSMFRIALPILQTLRSGGTLLIDELESSLHPNLAQRLVRQFNEPFTNPRNAQLIFTTHDTNLLGTTLGEPALRRDEVWLTEKNKDGATILYSLTDYRPRKAENLEHGYLQGRYGAIPFLGDLTLAGE